LCVTSHKTASSGILFFFLYFYFLVTETFVSESYLTDGRLEDWRLPQRARESETSLWNERESRVRLLDGYEEENCCRKIDPMIWSREDELMIANSASNRTEGRESKLFIKLGLTFWRRETKSHWLAINKSSPSQASTVTVFFQSVWFLIPLKVSLFMSKVFRKVSLCLFVSCRGTNLGISDCLALPFLLLLFLSSLPFPSSLPPSSLLPSSRRHFQNQVRTILQSWVRWSEPDLYQMPCWMQDHIAVYLQFWPPYFLPSLSSI